MPRVFVSIGSNIERARNVRSAVRSLRREFDELLISPVYESKSVGFQGEDFFNLAVGFDTDLPVEEVNRKLRAIESDHGRVRGGEKFSSRTLDLDVLLYGNLIDHSVSQDVPRTEITEYAFVLKPLCDIAGHVLHPETDETIADMWRKLGPRLPPVKIVDISL